MQKSSSKNEINDDGKTNKVSKTHAPEDKIYNLKLQAKYESLKEKRRRKEAILMLNPLLFEFNALTAQISLASGNITQPLEERVVGGGGGDEQKKDFPKINF